MNLFDLFDTHWVKCKPVEKGVQNKFITIISAWHKILACLGQHSTRT